MRTGGVTGTAFRQGEKSRESRAAERTRFLTVLLIAALLGMSGAQAPSRGEGNPLTLQRPNEVYGSVLTDRPLKRTVTSWYHGFYLSHLPEHMRDRYTGDAWSREQRNYLLESAEAGVDGPSARWSLGGLGEKTLDEFHRTYGMRFPYSAHHIQALGDARFVLSGGIIG